MTRPLIILDLDETLIHASEKPLARQPDFLAGPYAVYVRPFFQEFRAFLRQHCLIAVWTSSSDDYAAVVVNRLFPDDHLEMIWSRERCTRQMDYETGTRVWIKNLSKVKRRGFPLERVLAIDDSPEKLQRHYGNLIRVKSWEGDVEDIELRQLIPFLQWLLPAGNYRAVEKRGWRSMASQLLAAQSAVCVGAIDT